MILNEQIRKTVEDFANKQRLAAYKLRRAAFIEKYSKTPDNDYEAYYGAEMAQYIDARQWWEYIEQDKLYQQQERRVAEL